MMRVVNLWKELNWYVWEDQSPMEFERESAVSGEPYRVPEVQHLSLGCRHRRPCSQVPSQSGCRRRTERSGPSTRRSTSSDALTSNHTNCQRDQQTAGSCLHHKHHQQLITRPTQPCIPPRHTGNGLQQKHRRRFTRNTINRVNAEGSPTLTNTIKNPKVIS